jgi:uncharacterized protein YcfJ
LRIFRKSETDGTFRWRGTNWRVASPPRFLRSGVSIRCRLREAYRNGKKISGNAAWSGAVTGAIIGAAGPEAGLAAKVVIGAVGGVSGGAVERGLNGEKVADPKAIAVDAIAGAVSPKVESVTGRVDRNGFQQI